MVPGRVFLFFMAISCALASDASSKFTSWIPKTLENGVKVLDLPVLKSADKDNVIVKPINGSWDNQGHEPVRLNIERKALECGSHDLKPGQSVNIESKKFPKPFPKNWQCTWNFKVSDSSSKISIACKPFILKGCKLNSLQISGGKTNKKFCGNKKKGIKASSSNNKMKVEFKSKRKTSKGFKCTVSASGSIETTTTTTMAPQTECKPCGTVNRAMRIVGGVETQVNEYPWQAALVEAGTNNVFCGAILYNDRYVITAAHCGAAIIEDSIATEVLFGAHDVNNPTSSVQRIAPTHLINPSSYNPDTNDNDIALLRLGTEVILNDQVKPACLPDPAKDYAGVDATVSGWGTTSEGGSMSSTLMEVTVPTLTNSKCQNQYENTYTITQNMICAGLPKGGKDSCQGDSGGPLVVEENGSWVLIGVVSFGKGCARKGKPGVYARVSQYLDFLSQNTPEGTNNLCEPPTCTPCGTVNRATRIMNGVKTEVNEYPWQVALVRAETSDTFCGAVVYNDRFILTAAHCIKAILKYKIPTEALFGAHDHNNPTSSLQRIPVTRATYLSSFDNVTLDNDIGLLELATPVTLSELVKPACLPNANEDYAGVNAIASGWGQTENGTGSNVLLEATMPTLSHTECNDVYGSFFPITENMICAGFSETSQNICFGDSGGPLVVEENEQWTLIGLMSWTVNKCAEPSWPSGFARVSRYLDFLANTAASGQNNLCSKK